jgi:hypothetical protein
MKEKLIRLGLLTILFTTLSFGVDKIITLGEVKDRPVDEGHENRPKEDKVKGITKINKVFKSQTLSLAKEKGKIYKIIIEKVRQAPITCKIIRDKKELESLSKKQRKNLVFDIDTSMLKVDDNITLVNRKGEAIWEILVKR